MKSLQGQLLLDGGKLAGSEFHRTVVLICQHDPTGAFGLVLNRPSTERIADVIDIPLPATMRDLPLHLGGPVQPQMLSCLVHDPATKGGILPGLRLVHTPDEAAGLRVKFFAGYAGWSPGQLDGEMKADAWLTHPATMDHVFHPRPEELWKSILRSKGPLYRLLAESPDDVSRN
jgi:putative transcriptional regulator